MEIESTLGETLANGKADELVTLIWQFQLENATLNKSHLAAQKDRRETLRQAFGDMLQPAADFVRSKSESELNAIPESGTLIITTRRKDWKRLLEEAASQPWSEHLSVYENEMMEAHNSDQ